MCQIDLDGQVSASETKGARSKTRTHGQEPPLSARTVQIQIYRVLDPARKLRAVFEMFELALQLARSGTRMRHPDWTDEQVEVEARRLVAGSHSVGEQTATFMPAEAVILAKLRAYQASNSDRHRRDIEGILRVSGPDLDMDYIGLTAARLGLVHLWRELQETAMEE